MPQGSTSAINFQKHITGHSVDMVYSIYHKFYHQKLYIYIDDKESNRPYEQMTNVLAVLPKVTLRRGIFSCHTPKFQCAVKKRVNYSRYQKKVANLFAN